ncbi:MAG: exonuclease domain-containing protein [Opitutales bacterium]|jgi:DNA polymerase-3 subunit epsilon
MTDPAVILARYEGAFVRTWAEDTPAERVRFVAFDSESTGLDPVHDTLVSLGAVAVQGGEILLDQAFEAMLKLEYNNSMVMIHGITRDESLKGRDEAEALLDFLDYLGDGVIVGHHIGHDVAMLNVALQAHFGIKLRNRTLDTMELTLHLEQAGLLPAAGGEPNFTFDALCARFHIPPHDRHTAHGDAFLAAQLLLKLLRLAKRAGRGTLGSVCEPFKPAGVAEPEG